VSQNERWGVPLWCLGLSWASRQPSSSGASPVQHKQPGVTGCSLCWHGAAPALGAGAPPATETRVHGGVLVWYLNPHRGMCLGPSRGTCLDPSRGHVLPATRAPRQRGRVSQQDACEPAIRSLAMSSEKVEMGVPMKATAPAQMSFSTTASITPPLPTSKLAIFFRHSALSHALDSTLTPPATACRLRSTLASSFDLPGVPSVAT